MKPTQEKMAHSLDIKSIIIGILLCISIAMLFGAYRERSEALDVIGPFSISSGAANNAFILDTRTGHVWQVDQYEYIDMGTPDEPFYKKSRID